MFNIFFQHQSFIKTTSKPHVSSLIQHQHLLREHSCNTSHVGEISFPCFAQYHMVVTMFSSPSRFLCITKHSSPQPPPQQVQYHTPHNVYVVMSISQWLSNNHSNHSNNNASAASCTCSLQSHHLMHHKMSSMLFITSINWLYFHVWEYRNQFWPSCNRWLNKNTRCTSFPAMNHCVLDTVIPASALTL